MTKGGTQINMAELTTEQSNLSTSWDRETENSPVYAVISAVAEATDSDPLELPPLNEAIDPDALNTLFTSRPNTSVNQISFKYAGYEVVVRGSGKVGIRPTCTS